MSYYQLNCLNDGCICRCEDFEAKDDSAAMKIVRSLHGVGAAELWRGREQVCRFEPAEETA